MLAATSRACRLRPDHTGQHEASRGGAADARVSPRDRARSPEEEGRPSVADLSPVTRRPDRHPPPPAARTPPPPTARSSTARRGGVRGRSRAAESASGAPSSIDTTVASLGGGAVAPPACRTGRRRSPLRTPAHLRKPERPCPTRPLKPVVARAGRTGASRCRGWPRPPRGAPRPSPAV